MQIIKLLLLTVNICLSVCSEFDGWLTVDVFHQIGCKNANFCPRGKISLKSIRSGTAVIEQEDLSPLAVKELHALADQNAFYVLMTRVVTSDMKEEEFLTSMKAKAYVQSGYNDIINAWINNNGNVVSVSAQVDSNGGNRTENQINTKFALRQIEQAPVPDTASYIQKLEREREAREKGDVKDNRSFLSKYWMYIVPIAIFVMLSGAGSPDQGGTSGR